MNFSSTKFATARTPAAKFAAVGSGPEPAPRFSPVPLRVSLPLLFLAVSLASLGKFSALVILALPLVTFFALFVEGSDTSLAEIGDAFSYGAFIAPPLLVAVEFFLALALALAYFGMDDTYAIFHPHAGPEHQRSVLQIARTIQTRYNILYTTTFTLMVALAEEALKLVVGASLCARGGGDPSSSALNTRRRVLWVCGAVGLGLAFGESALAVAGMRGDGARNALERVMTSVPLHVGCAVLSGARLASGFKWLGALFPSFAVHGLFDLVIVLVALAGAPRWLSLCASGAAACAAIMLAKSAVHTVVAGDHVSLPGVLAEV